MSEEETKHRHHSGKKKNLFDVYLSKILVYVVIALAVTVLLMLAVTPLITNYVHKAEHAYAMTADDLVLDDSFSPLSLEAPPTVDGALIGKKLGVITCEAVGLNESIYCGAERASMREGVGYFTGDSLFGEAGRTYLCGYRTTALRTLAYISEGDTIHVLTEYGEFDYTVTEITEADNQSVPDGYSDDTLVLAALAPMLSEEDGTSLYVVAEREVN